MTFENSEKKIPSSFGYSLYPDKEVGFYVVCSDRMILDNINSMMKNRGFIGISLLGKTAYWTKEAAQRK